MNWIDITTHSHGTKDRTARAWELRAAGLRIRVARHIHYPPDVWLLTCDPWYGQREISRGTADEAKEAALNAVREKLAESIAALKPNA